MHIRCVFVRFASAKRKKKMEPRLSTLWVFLSVAFRLSETHIRLPEKNWGHICPRFFCAFRLSETPKIKMPFFLHFASTKRKKMGTRLSTLFLRDFP